MSAFTVSILTATEKTKQHWQALLVADSPELLVLHGQWERLLHMQVGEVPVKNQTLECYWPQQPYTVSAVYDQNWQLREYYARMLNGFRRDEYAVQFIDMGRHLSVKPNDDVRVIEEAEHHNHNAKPNANQDAGWEALLASAHERTGPFAKGFFDPYRPA